MKKQTELHASLVADLLMLCWYLETNSDFSSTTRRDMVEAVLPGIANLEKNDKATSETAIGLFGEKYRGHPLEGSVKDWAKKLLLHSRKKR